MQNLVTLICCLCKKQFKRRYSLWVRDNKRGNGQIFCSFKCQRNRRILLDLEKYCLECGKQIPFKEPSELKEKKFCNNSCAASFNNKRRKLDYTKTKEINCTKCNTINIVKINTNIQEYICDSCAIKEFIEKVNELESQNKKLVNLPHRKKLVKTSNKIPNGRNCIECNKELCNAQIKFCSKICLEQYNSKNVDFVLLGEKGGNSSKQISNPRSKNEIYFYELCNNVFSNVKHNEKLFNGWDADVILTEEKIAILWNGAWHYKQCGKNHSLEQT